MLGTCEHVENGEKTQKGDQKLRQSSSVGKVRFFDENRGNPRKKMENGKEAIAAVQRGKDMTLS